MKLLTKNYYLLSLFGLLLITPHQLLAKQVIESNEFINMKPVNLDSLDESRGLGGITEVTNNLNFLDATLTDNNATNNVNGFNIIERGSFSEASGVFSVIQNTGNNVIIQDSTIISITINPN